ncbi:MAG: thiolase domain-containing protein, partial [Anaerolineales bacterium]|nr:thiolase domain-containing protein [Anaerolineales bacterium]
MRSVSVVGVGQLPVEKASELSLRQLGGKAVRRAIEDAGVDRVDALFTSNMLADEMQGQKHIATLIAEEAKLFGIEALQVRAAMAGGAAAIRVAFLSVASGEADVAIAVGAEKMSEGVV